MQTLLKQVAFRYQLRHLIGNHGFAKITQKVLHFEFFCQRNRVPLAFWHPNVDEIQNASASKDYLAVMLPLVL